MKLVHIVQYHKVFLEFDNGLIMALSYHELLPFGD